MPPCCRLCPLLACDEGMSERLEAQWLQAAKQAALAQLRCQRGVLCVRCQRGVLCVLEDQPEVSMHWSPRQLTM